MNPEKTIQNIMDSYVSDNFTAGANLLVFKDGKEALYAESGYADIALQKKICRDTIFTMFSMTKPITAAAIMLLMERGELDLFEPVKTFLPGFSNPKVHLKNGGIAPAKRDIFVYDLLNMTAGIPYPNESALGKAIEKVFETPDITTIDFANQVGECGLMFSPGDRFDYGASADIAGAVIEIVSHKRLGDFLRDEIFAPLGMDDTGFFVESQKAARLSKVYESDEKGISEMKGRNLNVAFARLERPRFESGGAGLFSTIDDYMKFAQMLINGGGGILSEKSIDWLTKPQMTQKQTDTINFDHLKGFSYGGFMRILVDEGAAGLFGSKGEYGWDGWLGSYFNNNPKTNTSIVFCMQRKDSGTTSLLRKLKNVIELNIK